MILRVGYWFGVLVCGGLSFFVVVGLVLFGSGFLCF